MCGRYGLVDPIAELEARYQAENPGSLEFLPDYNIGPGTMAPVITNIEKKEIRLMQFGLTPFWAQKKMYLFNARCEGDQNSLNDPDYVGEMGLFKKPAFRDSIMKRRCLVPANFFFEGPEKEKLSKPYLVYSEEKPWITLGGIWDTWKFQGNEFHSFAILTTPANSILKLVGHHRAPLMIHESESDKWLAANDPNTISSFFRPYEMEKMNAFRVSEKLKNPLLKGSEVAVQLEQKIRE